MVVSPIPPFACPSLRNMNKLCHRVDYIHRLRNMPLRSSHLTGCSHRSSKQSISRYFTGFAQLAKHVYSQHKDNRSGLIPSSVLSSPAQKTKSKSLEYSLTKRPTISPLLISLGRTSRLALPVNISIACLGMMACSRCVCSSLDCQSPNSGSALR